MAANNNPRGPQTWAEMWRASLWRFGIYRQSPNQQRQPNLQDYENARNFWMGMAVPPQIPQNIFNERIAPFAWSPVQGQGNRDLNGPMPLNPTQTYLQARDRLHDVQNYFANEHNWRYTRSLEYGRNTLSVLYRHETYPPFDLVVKVSLRGWESYKIRHEQKATRKMARSAHFVQTIPRQRVRLPEIRPYEYEQVPSDDSSEEGESSGEESREDEPDAAARDNRTRRQIVAADPVAARRKTDRHERRMRAARRARASRYDGALARYNRNQALMRQGRAPIQFVDIHDENRKDFLLLQHCRFGDLETLVARLAEEDEMIPNRVLWSFFLCLVRACIGMAYPVRKFHPRRRDPPPPGLHGLAAPFVRANLGWNAGDELFEEIPDQRRRWAGKHFVHFDLDLKNIFIYGTDARARDNEHRIVPGLKIGELGHSEDVKIRKTNAYYFNMRGKGRFGYYTPEQFCQDWHYISKPDGSIVDPDGPEVSEQPVAGNYGSATNVWGIGLIMWQLMTRMQPPVPPQPQPEIQLGPGMVIPTHYCPLLLTMREYDVYDLELRLVVAYCLTANPQLRPALSNLLNAARRGIDSNFIGEDDNTIREWVRRFIYNPI